MDSPLQTTDREFEFTHGDFARVRALLYKLAGISLNESKRNMVYSRLSRRLRERRLESVSSYLDLVEAGGEAERQAFVNSLTTNLTRFYREPHHFPILAEVVKRAVRERGAVRLWCAAASTGEEPWTMAITALEAIGASRASLEILASDIDTQVLATARAAMYGAGIAEDIPEGLLKRWFQAGTGAREGLLRVRPEVQAHVKFLQVNLLAPDWPVKGPFDAIFCRNVMIYFDRPTQQRLLERFAPMLGPDGRLFVGHSENLGYARSLFEGCGRTVYVRAGTIAAPAAQRLARAS